MRTLASSAPKGSSSSSTVGSIAIARASATRWRWPPDSCAGGARDIGHLHQRRSSSTRLRAPAPSAGACGAAGSEPECNILEHAHVREQGVVLEHEADLALAQGQPRRVLPAKKIGPRSTGSRPAISRSSVVLPEPEGPSSATSCPDGMSVRRLQCRDAVEVLADAFQADFHSLPFSAASRRGAPGSRRGAVPARVSGQRQQGQQRQHSQGSKPRLE